MRLLKLPCETLFDSSAIWAGKKIAARAYETVYKCETGLAEPEKVAIKKISVPKSIYDRFVLHDIFIEITSLEEFQLEKCVADLFDYGLDKNDYNIVIKRYSLTIKERRSQQKEGFEDNILKCLRICKELLKLCKLFTVIT